MISTRWYRFAGILPLVGALVGVAGCGGEGSAPGAPPSEAAAEQPLVQAPAKGSDADKVDDADGRDRGEGARDHRGGRHGLGHGPEHLLRAALHELDLSDAQKATIKGAIDGLRDGAKGPPKDLAVFTALAEGVRAGAIDKAAIEAKLPSADRGQDERLERVAAALSTLHSTLTKEQRRKLVDAVNAKMDEHGAKGERGSKGERASKDEGGPMGKGGPRGERGAMGGHGMKGGPLGHILRDLNLRDEQRAQIEKALEGMHPSDADRDAMKKDFKAKGAEMRAKMEAFAADSFDAKAFLPASKEGPRAHLDGMVSSLAAIVPILDKAQRDALADRLAEGPRAGKLDPDGAGMRGRDRR